MGKNPKSPSNSQKKTKSEGELFSCSEIYFIGSKKNEGKELTIPYYQVILIVNK